MRLRLKLELVFGGLIVLVAAALAGSLYWQVRYSFVQRSEEQARALAKSAAQQGDRQAAALSETLTGLARDYQVGILFHEAVRNGSAQRRLIDLISSHAAQSALQELTAISPGGVILARGHRAADFGDEAESTPVGRPYLSPGSTMLRLRQNVYLQSHLVGQIEGGLDLSDDLAEMGRMFSGQVVFAAPGSEAGPATVAGAFEFVTRSPWTLPDGTILADLVFSRTDETSRRSFQRLILQAGLVFLMVLVTAAYFIFKISYAVTRPIRLLADAASEISRGNRNLHLPARTPDEVGALTESFSRMAASLDESQKKLGAAERLAAWQDAARMLAHEIKNPLSPIKTTASTLARAAREGDPQLGSLTERGAATILNEIGQLEKLLAEFSSFARFPSPRPTPGDFNSVVKQTADSLRTKLKDVRWAETYAAHIPPALVDPGMFSEVVRNLILNAADAVCQAPQKIIRIETSSDGRFAILTLADSGSGIEPDRQRTLFTPYFTTKPGGTGLGLAVSRKIAIEHGGDLVLLDTSPYPDASGAAFRAKVPLAKVSEP